MRGALACLSFAMSRDSGRGAGRIVEDAAGRLTRIVETLDLALRVCRGEQTPGQVDLAAGELICRASELAGGDDRVRGARAMGRDAIGAERLRCKAHDPGTALALAAALDVALAGSPLGAEVTVSADEESPAGPGGICLRVVPAALADRDLQNGWRRIDSDGALDQVVRGDGSRPPGRREFALTSAAALVCLGDGELWLQQGAGHEAIALVLPSGAETGALTEERNRANPTRDGEDGPTGLNRR